VADQAVLQAALRKAKASLQDIRQRTAKVAVPAIEELRIAAEMKSSSWQPLKLCAYYVPYKYIGG
jgi:hypothetical protein